MSDMSFFAKSIMEQKYAHDLEEGRKETWDEIADRVSHNVMKALGIRKNYIDDVKEIISKKQFIPGGRYLYASGRPFHQVQNCFDGQTEFITSTGIKTFEQTVNSDVLVRNRLGEWENAEVRCFGEQEIVELTLANGEVINTTEEHLWWQPDNSRVMTCELEEVLLSKVVKYPDLDEEGIRHGIIFGDGHVIKNKKTGNPAYSQIVFVNPEKDQHLVSYFKKETRPVTVGFGAVVEIDTVRETKRGTIVSLQPYTYKRLPKLTECTPEYARGFIAGLIATDGHVSKSGSVTINCENFSKAKNVAKLAVLAGCIVTSTRITSTVNPYNGSQREMCTIFIKPASAPIILPSHIANIKDRNLVYRNMTLEVLSVVRTGRFEPVYCVVAPETQSFTLANGVITSNCLLLRAEDSREGWADLMQKASMALMTGAGIGIDYSHIRPEGKPVRKTGGFATGPLALMQMVNEAGRGIMQGGSRRSAIWAGLNWKHADAHKFVTMKNWIPEVRHLKEKDFNFPATMDGTNISIQLDDEFFIAFKNEKHPLHSQAQSIYWATVRQMLKTAEPGFSVDVGDNKGETLRNAPVSANTYVMTQKGYVRVGDIVGSEEKIWTGKRWAPTTFNKTKEHTSVVRVNMTGGRSIVCDPTHEFFLEDGTKVQASLLQEGDSLAVSLPKERTLTSGSEHDANYIFGYIYGDGSFHKKYPRAEITLCTEESKKCLSRLDTALACSVTPSDSRGYTRIFYKNHELLSRRDKAVFPEDAFSWPDECLAYFIAGLFDADGNYFEEQNRVRVSSKHKEFLVGVRRALEQLGILSGISTAGISTYGQNQGYTLTVNTEYVSRFSLLIPTLRLKVKPCSAYRATKVKVVSVEDAGYEDVFCCDVKFEEHSFMAEGVIIANCTEVTSSDDSDICNLGSINLAKINTLEEMQKVTELATLFLLAGTVYSHVPYAKVDEVRTKNRRLGLGLMGIHEWLLLRGKKYEVDLDLDKYLKIYATSTQIAKKYADKYDISAPVKTRAIAPTGTIGIIAETTTGIEPVFCVAYKRRYKKGSDLNAFQYVIDPTAKRLIDKGVNPDLIEDAYTLSEDVERRVSFQAWVQEYVDHSISSTINLPSWGSEKNNDNNVHSFGNMLINYLPKLRGITCYPDGARGGQPLTPVRYSTASKHIGEVFYETADVCDITKAGSCGS